MLERNEASPHDVIVIHETNGRKYLEALCELHRAGRIRSLEFFEASVLWKLAHGIVRERRSPAVALKQSLRNLRFRFGSARLRGKTIVICLPPWDFRLPFYARLRRHNRIVYNTSWPYWLEGRVPRRAGVAGPWLRRRWRTILSDQRVRLTAVTEAAANELSVFSQKPSTIVPHVVSEKFFEQRASHRVPLRLLFAGELVETRGLATLREVIRLLSGEPVVLNIIGDGPLRKFAAELAREAGGTWYGHVSDRAAFVRIVASSQVFVSPAIRSSRWEELFGMAIVEAMACGVPCIASDHIGPRSIIEHERSGVLLPEKSPAAIADWVRRLIHDAESWTRMSAAARERAAMWRMSSVAARWDAVLSAASD
jgi:glycosyltransferase involved in cell wall biosynthesis